MSSSLYEKKLFGIKPRKMRAGEALHPISAEENLSQRRWKDRGANRVQGKSSLGKEDRAEKSCAIGIIG